MGDKAPVPGVVPITPIQASIDEKTQSSSGLSSVLDPLVHNAVAYSIRDVWRSISDRRAALGLPNPGTVEDVSKEVSRDVFLKNLMFSGFRAEFTKAFSTAPLFQTAHSLAMGGNGGQPPYSFAALYGSPRIFMQGNVDNEFAINGRLNYRPFSALTIRNSLQLAPASAAGPSQSMLQIETSYKGPDYCLELKAMNPSILEANNKLSGIIIGSYLQSLTPRLALGIETMWQRQTGDEPPQTITSYAARYKAGDWIASGQLMPTQGVLNGAYWRRLSRSVEAGLDINISLLGMLSSAMGGGANLGPMMGQLKNEGTATMGAKYDFRNSVFRAQIDSTGKVAALLERRITPVVQFTFGGEMDHSKGSTRMGMAVQIESGGSEEFMEQQERIQMGQEPAPSQDVPPF